MNRANTICSTSANFDFGQFDFGQLAEVELAEVEFPPTDGGAMHSITDAGATYSITRADAAKKSVGVGYLVTGAGAT